MVKIDKRIKYLLVILGVFLAIVFCELFLKLTSLVNKTGSLPRYDLANVDEGALTVFCFGDSFTYGIGAGFEKSYPAQLQEILNAKGVNAQVFNFGVPGYNSSQTLNRFKKMFSQVTPDIVVIMSGSNDNWNFSSLVLPHKMSLFKTCFSNTRLYRLIAAFAASLQNKFPGKDLFSRDLCEKRLAEEQDYLKLVKYGNTLRDYAYYDYAERFYSKAVSKDKDACLARIELGRCYKQDKQYQQSISVLGMLLKRYPDKDEIYLELQDVFIILADIKQKVLFFEAMHDIFPDKIKVKNALIDAYVTAAGECLSKNNWTSARLLYTKALSLNPDKRESILQAIQMADLSAKSEQRYLSSNFKINSGALLKLVKGFLLIKSSVLNRVGDEVLFDNLAKIIESCKKGKAEVIISEYPCPDDNSPITNVGRQLALRYKVPIVKHKDIFLGLLNSKQYEYYFVSKQDPHCTEHGYRVMAENIAQAIFTRLKD